MSHNNKAYFTIYILMIQFLTNTISTWIKCNLQEKIRVNVKKSHKYSLS